MNTSPVVSIASSSSQQPAPPKVLSCTNCRRRKIRCNKTTSPCLPCQASGTECIFPTRVRNPRPRQNNPRSRDAELLKRISHLESLVSRIDASKLISDDGKREEDVRSNESSSATRLHRSFTSPSNQTKIQETGLIPGLMDHQFASFIKRQETDSIYSHDGFWTRLSEEIDGLKQLIESPSDDEEEPVGSSATSPSLQNTGRHKFKSLEAVAFSMYFAAVTSMTNEECLEHLDEERDILVARYKTATEIALQESDFLNSVEIVTLQALILYIAVLRSHDRSRTTWTYIGLAVRIARAIGLHRDPGYGEPFDLEMRRKVWWTLLSLDTRASEDRGTETMITDGSFDTKMPANINDEDLMMTSKTPAVDRKGLTNMTLACITMSVCGIGLKMNFIPTQKDAPVLTSEQKEQMIKEFTDRIESTYLVGCDPLDPEYLWLYRVSRLLSLKLWLVTQYPLQRRKSTNRVLPRGQILRTATAFLNLTEEMWQYEKSKGWFWYFQTYVPWHAIAVALAELCAEPTGKLADEAWEVIQYHYNKWSEYVADTKDGMIWRPVKNLLKRARAARGRERGFSGSQASTITSPFAEPNIYGPSPRLDTGFSSLMPDNNIYNQPPVIGQVDPIGQNSHGTMGFDLPIAMSSTPMDNNIPSPLPAPLPDAYTNTHWNEFIYGLGTVGADGPGNPEMWGSYQDYFTGSQGEALRNIEIFKLACGHL
ncbi:hypothetical protein DID88_008585 [Monilinia fructigena]|uniref:Zn(2)-C6 fungal-type domain-containing protein n=1 Tax=Monilinia fructigena TaxID=38457 RepID=A0A395JAW4_9HELO|nr:hypothetical protein DID88_008585 [Monilinia fructigena]